MASNKHQGNREHGRKTAAMATASAEAQRVDAETKLHAGVEVSRSDDSTRRGLRWFWPIVGGLLLLQAFLAADCARRWSPTHDEYWHLPIGVFYWQTADWRVDPINPPLVRMWASLPLVVGGVGLELPEKSGWPDRVPMAEEVGDAFHDQHAGSYRQHFFMARLMMIPLGTMAGLLLVIWARQWFGESAGLLAAMLWVTCPTVLAHSSLVAHDLPATLGAFATVAACVYWQSRPTGKRACLWGTVLGLALLTKLTVAFVLPVCVGVWVMLPKSAFVTKRREIVWQIFAGLFMTWLVLSLQFFALGVLPAPYLAEWEALREVLAVKHPVFLDGEWNSEGFRSYYLWALIWKLPLAMLVCLMLAMALIVKKSRIVGEEIGVLWRRNLLIMTGVAVFVIPASLSGNQLGIRYVLPAFPFLMLFAAQAAGWWQKSSPQWMNVVGVMLIVCMPLSLRQHPDHLAYFNLLAGGSEGGIHRLSDSNLDWGQDLYRLQEYLDTNEIELSTLAYFGSVRPWKVGLTQEAPAAYTPAPGWHAVSANYVQGRPHALRLPDGSYRAVNLDEFGYFRFFEPAESIGGSIFLFHLNEEDVERYVEVRERMRGR
ncbi:ArnT family glycosyltransferase [Planctopirus hydrillae]|uniref:Glycosyltransferase RgtA/B/C/D-like domain-containing protein n=1 Tax=Planctopirus hydrillae TaxID=1841610 RepID=A0A1C3EQE4_9PLAN|nr:phospholipid carrier-dependent glycosyltransferase [Planctopirus hydrillae]ODA35464.1 hypothetical protein A6X21_16750 [Planctopirus hydrillae]